MREYSGTRRRGMWGMGGALLLALVAGGCAGRPDEGSGPAHVEAQVGKGSAFIESGVASVEAARPHTNAVGLAYLDAALDALARAGRAMMAADEANRRSAQAMERLEAERSALEEENGALRGRFWSVRQRSLFWKAVVGVAVVCALRMAGLWLTGGAGRVAAWLGTGLLGLLSGGLSLVQALFDNLWFRWRAAKAGAGEGAR